MTLQAIETHYAGCRFRSRLEARWAVFFDALNLQWEYEPQGYELRGLTDEDVDDPAWLGDPWPERHREHLGYYLPDFWLPEQRAWLEIKPGGHDPEDRKLERFGLLAASEGRFFLVPGQIPTPQSVTDYGPDEDQLMTYMMGYWDNYYAWTRCASCGSLDLKFEARSARNGCRCHQKVGSDCTKCGPYDPRSSDVRFRTSSDRCHNGADPLLLAAYSKARSARFEHGESP